MDDFFSDIRPPRRTNLFSDLRSPMNLHMYYSNFGGPQLTSEMYRETLTTGYGPRGIPITRGNIIAGSGVCGMPVTREIRTTGDGKIITVSMRVLEYLD